MQIIERTTNLQHVLYDLKIAQARIVKHLQSLGIKTSDASFSRLKIRSVWPKKYNDNDKEKCRKAVEQFLVDNGATPAHLENLWEFTEKKPDYIPDNEVLYEDPEPEMLTNNAKRFFKLKHNPFENEITCEEDVYLAENHRLILEEMLSAASAGSMAALIGECGSGKTIVRRAFISRIQQDHPEVILIQPARLDRRKMTADSISVAICRALQIEYGRSAEQRDAAIEAALIESANNGYLHLIVVDEAHDLPIEVIKMFKRIWELTHGYKRVMGIVLIGQTELKKKLESQHVREFTWRCSQIDMQPLGLNVPSYIRHKFERAGVDADHFFDEDAMMEIRQRCSGKIRQGLGLASVDTDRSFPLHVNTWLTRALNTAAQIGEKQITTKLIQRIK